MDRKEYVVRGYKEGENFGLSIPLGVFQYKAEAESVIQYCESKGWKNVFVSEE